MRILFITTHITNSIHPAFWRNQTGFGYMVYNIAKYVAKVDDVDMFVANAITPPMELDGIKILGNSWNKFIKSLRISNFVRGIKFAIKYHISSVKRSLRVIYMNCVLSQIEETILNYDVVHIHGCSELTEPAIRLCKKHGVKFLVTLHGLNSFENSIRIPLGLRQYERDFLREAAQNHYPVSFISTGNMNTAIDSVGMDVDSFSVINNGCNIIPQNTFTDIRKNYDIKENDFLFVFVGNISKNKNQIQVAKAWNLLPNEEKKYCKVAFVGRFTETDEIVHFIKNKNLKDNLILCGIMPHDQVDSFYKAANATILTSLTEGFGLSIIEGFVYGKPNVTFADLPATPDLYNSEAMILADDRSDIALSRAMSKAIHLKFDANAIKKHSQKFSLERMAEKYCSKYKEILL